MKLPKAAIEEVIRHIENCRMDHFELELWDPSDAKDGQYYVLSAKYLDTGHILAGEARDISWEAQSLDEILTVFPEFESNDETPEEEQLDELRSLLRDMVPDGICGVDLDMWDVEGLEEGIKELFPQEEND